MKKFCGIEISDNTIKKLCDKESVKIETWQKTDPLCTLDFQNSSGEPEFTTDGTMVNTLDGWREFRIGIFVVRILDESATPEQWADRHLPKPHDCVAFAAMEDKDTFRARWGSWVNRLKISDKLPNMSTLGDGAYCRISGILGDACQLEFGKTRENLDIYHALEYLSENAIFCTEKKRRNQRSGSRR